jgi:hypothetical protein
MGKTPGQGGRRAAAPPSADLHPRPHVIVDFVFDEGMLFIAIENIGEKPALNVSIRFDHAFRGLGGIQVIPDLALFHGIRFLAPRRRITTFVDATAAYFARREPTDLMARIAYSDAAGTAYDDVIRHDLAIYRDLPYLHRTAAPGDTP